MRYQMKVDSCGTITIEGLTPGSEVVVYASEVQGLPSVVNDPRFCLGGRIVSHEFGPGEVVRIEGTGILVAYDNARGRLHHARYGSEGATKIFPYRMWFEDALGYGADWTFED